MVGVRDEEDRCKPATSVASFSLRDEPGTCTTNRRKEDRLMARATWVATWRPPPDRIQRGTVSFLSLVRLPGLVVGLVLLGSPMVRAGTEPKAPLHVESNITGEIGIEARGVTLDEALGAIASKAGFEVVIEPGVARPPVNIAVSMAPVEDVLREVLRGRNYALVYEGDDTSLSQVIVLRPPSPRRSRVVYRRH
jgi:hypothetical protein